MSSNNDNSSPSVSFHDPTANERRRLHTAVGSALARWADIEHGLSVAFAVAIRTNLMVGQQVFLSSRSFDGKKKMIESAVRFGKKAWSDDKGHVAGLRALDKAMGRIDGWSRARDRIAHNTLTIMTVKGVSIGGVVTPTGLDFTPELELTIPVAEIEEAAENFKRMSLLLSFTAFDFPLERLEERRQQFDELPKAPYSTTVETLLSK